MHDSKLQHGIEVITKAANIMPQSPGIYKMISHDGEILYIGKARILPKRVISYASVAKLSYRIKMMVSQIDRIEFLLTDTEAQALLLEANLINTISPRYNILLKDDKSFPYIAIEESHKFPRIVKHRGTKKRKNSYYGPFASVEAVNEVISELQKVFKIRPCTDSYFASRSKPCLQYQMHRCSAPCVEKISTEEYKNNVQEAKKFLTGKTHELQKSLALQMQAASDAMDFEKAAIIRDKIKLLSQVQARNITSTGNLVDSDVFGLYKDDLGNCCVQVFFIRNGKNFGNKPYLFESFETDKHTIQEFVLQFYQINTIPTSIVLSHIPESKELLCTALRTLNKKSKLLFSSSPQLKDLIEFAVQNAKQSLISSQVTTKACTKNLELIKEALNLTKLPELIEVYDNSHIQGNYAFGCYITAEHGTLNKKLYRVFKMSSSQAKKGDDYAMMKETIARRFKKPGRKPDLIIIDGGKGQLKAVLETLSTLGASEVEVVSMSKGEDRNSGREFFHMNGKKPFQLPIRDPALRYLHTLRNEAHRFAITTHRKSIVKSVVQSGIDSIPKIGAVRKTNLLSYFGSFELLKKASINDIARVPGINKKIAKTIHNYLQNI